MHSIKKRRGQGPMDEPCPARRMVMKKLGFVVIIEIFIIKVKYI